MHLQNANKHIAIDSHLIKRRVLKSQQLAKLFGCQPGCFGDVAHGDGMDGIVPGDGQCIRAFAHDGVLALADHAPAQLLQDADGIFVVDSRELGHGVRKSSVGQLDRGGLHFQPFIGPLPPFEFLLHFQDLADGILDVGERFFPRLALTPAAWDGRAADCIAFIGLNEHDRVFHEASL